MPRHRNHVTTWKKALLCRFFQSHRSCRLALGSLEQRTGDVAGFSSALWACLVGGHSLPRCSSGVQFFRYILGINSTEKAGASVRCCKSNSFPFLWRCHNLWREIKHASVLLALHGVGHTRCARFRVGSARVSRGHDDAKWSRSTSHERGRWMDKLVVRSAAGTGNR
jgi:hypothetical protein